jgi:signal transduction histidine kinase
MNPPIGETHQLKPASTAVVEATTHAPARDTMRWWGAVAGALLAVVDTFGLASAGVTFSMSGRDVTLLTCGYFAVSFATLGFLVGYVVDLRRRDRRSAALVEAQMRAIDEARARLAQSEKLAALGQLAATIAHEVRNPLAVIRSAAQDIGEYLPPNDEDARRNSSFITAEVDRLTSVVSSLLAFARPLKIERREVVVADLFERALLLARGPRGVRQVPVQQRVAVGLPPLDVDADLLCQVLVDLLANAAEAVPPEGGEIALEAQAADRDRGVEIRVVDSGPGVPADLRARIFEPFFTTRPGGTGLGLAVARQIVEGHGGRIAAGERPGGGSGACFTIWLPAAASARAAA